MSGGGAAGCIEVGMLDALQDKDYVFTHAYGTSTGALNAAGLAYQGLPGAKDIWMNLKKDTDIFKPNWPFGPLYGDSLYSSKPLRGILEKHLIGEPRIPATVASVSLKTGLIQYDQAGSDTFLESTLASASVPLHVAPVNGLVDGGVRDITPLSKAIKDGHDHIVVLLASPWHPDAKEDWQMPSSKWFRGFKIAVRSVSILASEVFRTDIEMCLLKNNIPKYKKILLEVYAPNTRTIETNSFNPEKIRENYRYGYEAAMRGPAITSEE